MCWVVTDGAAGRVSQALGLAEALAKLTSLTIVRKDIKVRTPWRAMPAWTWGDAPGRLSAEGARFTPPWPDIAIGCGRLTVPLCLWLKKTQGAFALQLQSPRWREETFDMIIAPAHDDNPGANVFSVIGSVNRLDPVQMAADGEKLAGALPLAGALAGAPRLAALIGGDSKAFRMTRDAISRIAADLERAAEAGAQIAVTFSRRTGAAAEAAFRRALSHPRIWIWDGRPVATPGGEALANPYPGLLAWADHVMVTADSANMLSEAATAGRPIHIAALPGGSPKFTRLHASLIDRGAARPFDGTLEPRTYMPLAETARAAEAAARRITVWRGTEEGT
ncbi:MAG: mitochondrial fission ELM1 family protein [Pseudomonadota bacterium]